MTAELVYSTDSQTRSGWDQVDRIILGVLSSGWLTVPAATLAVDLPPSVVEDAMVAYRQCGLVVRTPLCQYRLTTAGRRRLAQLSAASHRRAGLVAAA